MKSYPINHVIVKKLEIITKIISTTARCRLLYFPLPFHKKIDMGQFIDEGRNSARYPNTAGEGT